MVVVYCDITEEVDRVKRTPHSPRVTFNDKKVCRLSVAICFAKIGQVRLFRCSHRKNLQNLHAILCYRFATEVIQMQPSQKNLSVKLTKNGCENIWSVKVGVHHSKWVLWCLKQCPARSFYKVERTMTMVHLIQLKTNKWVQCGLMVTEVARVRFSVWEPFVNILTSLSE